jgi:hypothetical protein
VIKVSFIIISGKARPFRKIAFSVQVANYGMPVRTDAAETCYPPAPRQNGAKKCSVIEQYITILKKARGLPRFFQDKPIESF